MISVTPISFIDFILKLVIPVLFPPTLSYLPFHFFLSGDSYVVTFLVVANVSCYLDFQLLRFSHSRDVIHSNIETR
jgi:hypothetical protein